MSEVASIEKELEKEDLYEKYSGYYQGNKIVIELEYDNDFPSFFIPWNIMLKYRGMYKFWGRPFYFMAKNKYDSLVKKYSVDTHVKRTEEEQ